MRRTETTPDSAWFPALATHFEESVRIDRKDLGRDERDHRTEAIESYHLTSDSRRFIEDFIDRLLGEADDMRTGSNYWLYGYYGSGKSHLLAVLDALMDSVWLEGERRAVWDALIPDAAVDEDDYDFENLREKWQTVHETYHVIPVSVNLLKYQGQKQRSFSEIVLKHAHQNPELTGVEDDLSSGLSPQIDVAYFEDWYRTTEKWPERHERAETTLEDITEGSTAYDWQTETLWTDIQQYEALSGVVLPELFEEVTGTEDGYSDLQPSDIDPEAVVRRLEALRAARETDLEKPVKLVLLLDEVSLFIGTDFERLTELQTLAENVDEIADGDVQLVATAQAKIEDVQPKFAAHGADFSIVKDRFPHRYQLPSKHVGDIAKRRLLQKTEDGERDVRQLLEDADVKPVESLVFNEIKQNTKPPLDAIDHEELVEFYPFLPYHPPLFLEILFNLRQEAPDPAKSIFSGTARAILALMHGLLEKWDREAREDEIISLIDFYELIKPELRDILKTDMQVIEGVEAGSEKIPGIVDEVKNEESALTEFDLEVAKAILLLRHVHDIVPLNEGNIAVAVMSDLNGRSWISTTNRVEESLDRLKKYVRPVREEGRARYRFATIEERQIYEDAEEHEANPDWDRILQTLDEHLWDRIVQDLSLPESAPYGDSGDEYPVTYSFSVDRMDFETTLERESGLEIDVVVQGLRPGATTGVTEEETLFWPIDTDGLEELRKRLVQWWALRDAIATRDAPPAVEHDLEERATAVRRKIVSAMQKGSFAVEARTEIRGLSKAVRIAVDASYPDDFHPVMLQVDDDRLLELRELSAEDPLPEWARTIQVPSSNGMGDRGKKTIQNNVLVLAGRQLKDREDGLHLNTVLDGIVEEKPFYDETRPALRAILWGFCRAGRFLPVDEDGNAVENDAILDPTRASTTRLKLLTVPNIGKTLEEYEFKQTTETVQEGLINLREANRRLRSKLTGLREDVQLMADADVHADAVTALLSSFADELADRIDGTEVRLSAINAQDDQLVDAIERTDETERWFEEVVDVWERRRSSIYQLDAVLTVGAERFDWVSSETLSSLDDRRDAVAAFDGPWWTTDGWSTFSSELVPDLTADLEACWETFVDDQGLRSLVNDVDEHPWVIPSTELPAGVHRTFERELIAPLRALGGWYETLDRAIGALSAGDPDALVDAADSVSELEPLAAHVAIDIDDLEARFDRLSAIVGDRTFADVDHIGLVPDDRQALDRRLQRLVETQDLDLVEIDEGVIVR